jgi:hypothetical protein
MVEEAWITMVCLVIGWFIFQLVLSEFSSFGSKLRRLRKIVEPRGAEICFTKVSDQEVARDWTIFGKEVPKRHNVVWSTDTR